MFVLDQMKFSSRKAWIKDITKDVAEDEETAWQVRNSLTKVMKNQIINQLLNVTWVLFTLGENVALIWSIG